MKLHPKHIFGLERICCIVLDKSQPQHQQDRIYSSNQSRAPKQLIMRSNSSEPIYLIRKTMTAALFVRDASMFYSRLSLSVGLILSLARITHSDASGEVRNPCNSGLQVNVPFKDLTDSTYSL